MLENLSLVFPTRYDTYLDVEPQKIASGLKFRKLRNFTFCVAKKKTLISCAVTLQLICVFVFAYAKAGFLLT